MQHRPTIQDLSSQCYDLCIIGGGVTGAGIFKLAAQRGWKVLLLDKNDFGSGTSSRSSKILHGGIRYLKNLQIKMVWESLQSRREIMAAYPHLVTPFPVVLPLVKSPLDALVKHFFVAWYDWLARNHFTQRFRRYGPSGIMSFIRGFHHAGLRGGLVYWEATINDARLTNEVIMEGGLAGGLALNHCAVVGFGPVCDGMGLVRCHDQLTQQFFDVKARFLVNATGPWVDDLAQVHSAATPPRLALSKGIHLVIRTERLGIASQVLVQSVYPDKRYLYNVPWENGLTILGSTDTNYQGDKDQLYTTSQEITYLLDSFNRYFPHACLTQQDIVAVYAGLRPTLHDAQQNSYHRSREYVLWWQSDHLLTIAGGKLTSFLTMARKCITALESRLGTATPAYAMPLQPQAYQGPWSKKYGVYGRFIDQWIAQDPSLDEPVHPPYPLTKAELRYFVHYQHVRQINDLLSYRTTVTLSMAKFDPEAIYQFAQALAHELHQNDHWIAQEVSNYHQIWQTFHLTTA